MQRLVFLLSIFLIFSCEQEKPEKESIQATPDKEVRKWHLTDTLITSVKWTSDSIRQVNLDLNHLSELFLEVKSDAPVYLFYGDKLIEKSSDGYLQHSFNDSIRNDIFLSLDRNVQMLTYGIYTVEKTNVNGAYSSLENTERESKWISDNILLILLIGASLFMVIIKVNYDKRYLNILSFNKIFTTRLNEGDQSRMRIMDQDNFVFAGLYAFLTAGLIYFLSLGRNIGFLGIEPSGVIEFLKILIIVVIGLISKVVLVSIASNLFGNNKISAFYVKEMLNINLFFVIILFFSSISIFLFEGAIPAFWLSTAIYAMLAFYIIRLILLYFKILKLSSFTNLYLFSYFCTTEIFPFLIGLKYFMR
ncbi:DUF4271 domain-containing protein [Marivirga salinae]|uniref:DUF4271 domain-containing protein n=1 Tax=Marivirga salinarum TaxID=3059078 RepID=A0AA51NCG8_9BACT|nr:DUF4271 domain-containing protein [Marivirga sp. BDSF4-3]WMN12414.1 DUF4271 domain-containing protein [Marivirga sp. BDSF4-3]